MIRVFFLDMDEFMNSSDSMNVEPIDDVALPALPPVGSTVRLGGAAYGVKHIHLNVDDSSAAWVVLVQPQSEIEIRG